MKANDPRLSEASADDLFDEIRRRYPTGVIGAMMPDDGDVLLPKTVYWGHPILGLGLLSLVDESIKHNLVKIEP